MRRILYITTCACCLLFATNSHASNLNYNYFQIGYIQSDRDGNNSSIDGNIISFSGSYRLAQKINVIAGYQSANYDFDFERKAFNIGAGFHMPIAKNTDATASLSLLDVDTDQPSGIDDDTGTLAKVGVRHLANPRLEVNAELKYVDIFNESDTSFGAGVRFKFANDKSFGINYLSGDEQTDIELSFRMDL